MNWEGLALSLLSTSILRPFLLVAAALLILRVFRVQHPASKHAVWTWVLGGMLVLPLLSLVTPRLNFAILPVLPGITSDNATEDGIKPIAETGPGAAPARKAPIPEAAAPQPVRSGSQSTAPTSHEAGGPAAGPLPGAEPNPVNPVPLRPPVVSENTMPRPGTLLVWAYLAGLCIAVTRRLAGWLLLQRMYRRSRPLRRRVLRESADVVVPVTMSVIRPVVIVPAAWRDWPIHTRRAVLAHEFAHIRRRDTWTRALAGVVRCLLWFHPLTWWVTRKIALLAENACDADALKCVRDPAVYSRILLEFAGKVTRTGFRASLPGLAMVDRSGLGRRIDEVFALSDGEPRRFQRPGMLLVLVGIPVLCLTAVLGLTGKPISLAPLPETLAPGPIEQTAVITQPEPALPTPPEDAARSGSIAGVVTDSVTGRPIPDAMVSLWDSSKEPVSTDAEGRFALTGLEPGIHKVMVERDGYAPARPKGRKTPGNAGIALTVAPGEQLKSVAIQLVPGGVIMGTVVDTRGDPVEDATVNLAPVNLISRSWDPDGPIVEDAPLPSFAQATTNDRGDFRVFGIDPGEYYVHVREPSNGRGAPDGQSHASVYYPGVADVSRAQTVVVSGGEELRVGVISMPVVKTVPVHIRIVNETGEIPQTRAISIDRGSFFTSARSWGGPGAVEIPGLEPGRHDISVSWKTPDGVAFGQTTVEVGTQEVRADLVVRKGVRVNVRVLAESADGVTRPLAGAQVSFQAKVAGGGRLWGNLSGTSGPDGTFLIASIPTLDYRLNFADLPAGSYLIRARQSDRDLLKDNARITGDTEIEVVVGLNAGVVEGIVRDANGQKVSGAFVVLAPDERGNASLYRVADSDQDGRFVVRGVAPGSYKMFAWLNIEGPAYLNADYMKKFDERGQAVRVTRNQTAKLDISLADEEQTR